MFEDFKNNIRKIPFMHVGTVSHSMPVKSSCRHKDTTSDFFKKNFKKIFLCLEERQQKAI